MFFLQCLSLIGAVVTAGQIYFGQCAPGDRAATPTEISAWQAAQAIPAPGTVLAVTSTGTPALSGTYAINSNVTANITAEETSLLATASMAGGPFFTNGTSSISWPDTSGAFHAFTPSQFLPFALAVGKYVNAVIYAQQTSTALPAATAAIP